MRSSQAALTDSRSSVSRVAQRNLVTVTFPFFLLFFLGLSPGDEVIRSSPR